MEYLADAGALAGWWVLTEAWSWAAILSAFFGVLFTRYFMGREAMKELLKSLGIAMLTAMATALCFFVFYFVYSAPRQLLAESEAELTRAMKAPRLLYSETEENAAWPNSPYKAGKKILIQSNTDIAPFGIRVHTDKPVTVNNCRTIPSWLAVPKSDRTYGPAGDPNGAFIECRLVDGIGPQYPMAIWMYSTELFTVTKWEAIQEP